MFCVREFADDIEYLKYGIPNTEKPNTFYIFFFHIIYFFYAYFYRTLLENIN